MKISLLTLSILPMLPCFLDAAAPISFEKKHLHDVYLSEGAGFGDFNKDGQVDIVSGCYWYEGPAYQKKNEFSPLKKFDLKAYSDNFFAHGHDFNQDGWTDIMIVGFPGTAATLYLNPKGAAGHWPAQVILPKVDNESPEFLDLVGDSRPEIVCMSGGYVGYAAPEGADATKPWKFHPISPKGNYVAFTHGIGVGDVNGDGRKDVLDKDGWWEQPASLSEGIPWKQHPFAFSTGGSQMYVYDIDGDKDGDVITSLAAHGWGLAWYEQVKEGDKITFKQHMIMNSRAEESTYGVAFSQLHAVNLADMNGDGLLDIVAGKCWWAHGPTGDPEPNAPAVIYWFELARSGGKGAHFIPHQIDNDSGVGRQISIGKINQDGKLDLVVGNKKGTYLFLQKGS